MHSIWNFFLERRAFSILTMLALILAGFVSVLVIPKESAPEVKVPVGIVTTVLPGASSQDIERLVTNKLEDDIRNISNIDKVVSRSQSGVSVVVANFNASADIDKSIQDLRTAVDRAKGDLPEEATDPVVSEVNFADQPVIIAGISTDINPGSLTETGRLLSEQLERIPGVSKVRIAGTRDRETSIILNKSALSRNNLRIEQVIGAIAGANAALPSGSITVADVDYPVQFNGNISTPSEIANIPINTPTGIIPLKDIATVVDGFKKPTTISRLATDLNHVDDTAENALTLYVFKKSGGNVVSLTKEVRTRIDELKGTLLAGSNVVVTFDRGELVAKDLRELSQTGLETVVLVLVVLMITIGVREALIAALSIPLSFVIAFIGLYTTGNTINFISLFSLILGIGILVDSGIVVVEAIHTRREKGMDQITAAKEAIHEYAWPLIAGTMTTIAVFIPLFFLSGVTGKFLASIPFTIIAVLLASIFVALGQVPILTLMFGGSNAHARTTFADAREALWHKTDILYRAFLKSILESKTYQRLFFGTLTVFTIVAFSLPFTGAIKSIFFPGGNSDFIFVDIELPQASTLSATNLITKQVEDVVSKNSYVTSFVTTLGETSSFGGNGSSDGSKYANITLNLRKDRKKNINESSATIADSLRRDIAHITGAKISVMEPSEGPPSGSPIAVKISGDNLNDLSIATAKLEQLLASIPGTRDVTSSLSNDGTEIDLSIDREKAARYGLSSSNIATTLRAAVSGIKATAVRADGVDIDVRVTLDLNKDFVNPEDTTNTNIDAIRTIPIPTQRGSVMLGNLLSASLARNVAVISHEHGNRQTTVNAYLSKDANALIITNAFKKEAANISLPEGVTVSYGGDDEEVKRSSTEMGLALIAGLILAFTILVLEFNEFRSSLRLIAIVPLSIAGVLAGLAIMKQPLSITSMLGMIALAGVIINHGILLLDTMTRMRKSEHGHHDAESIVLDASAERLRPILLTTITTVIGMIPLTMISEMWAPLAWGIAFGLTFATVLTLIFIPVLSYKRMQKLERNEKMNWRIVLKVLMYAAVFITTHVLTKKFAALNVEYALASGAMAVALVITTRKYFLKKK